MNDNQDIKTKTFFHPGFQGWTYLVVTCSLLFTSCAQYYYAPNSNNIPLLSEKEAKINAQYSAGLISNGFECQSAFAISRHFGGMMNTMIGGSNDDDYGLSSGKTQTKFIEIGAGYFTPIQATSLVFETYGGIGTGGVNNIYTGEGKSKVRFTKIFVQPTFGIKVKGFEFGVSTRLNWVKQKVASVSGSKTNDYFAVMDEISKSPKSFHIEPSLVMRFGGEKFLIQLQYTGFSNLSTLDFEALRETGYFSIGFSIPIKYKQPKA